MAVGDLILATTPDLLTPVYNDIDLVITPILQLTDDSLYYKVVITVGSETRTFENLPDADKSLAMNLSKILRQFVESTIASTGSIGSLTSGSFISYSITATGYTDSETTTVSSGTKYAFNGITPDYLSFDSSDYMLSTGAYAKTLSTQDGDRDILINDKVTLQFITGTSNGFSSTLNSMTILAYYNDGTTNTATYSYSSGSTNGITTIDLTPSMIAANTSLTMDSTLNKYYVSGVNNTFDPICINIKEEDTRFNRHFRLAYINSLGGTDYLTLNKGYDNNLGIDKSTYSSNGKTKVYNIDADESIDAVSFYMSEDQSNGLKDLWVSPLVVDISDGYYREVIVNKSKVTIKHHRTDGLISYSIPFVYANKFRTLKQ